METFAKKTVVLKLSNGAKIEAEKALNYASGFLNDYLKASGPGEEEELPIPDSDRYQANVEDFKFLNKFIKFADEHFHKELTEHPDDQSFWTESLEGKKEQLLNLAKDVPDERIICSINLGDFLITKSFVMFCCLVLYERVHTLKLDKLRQRFNEVDDFSEDVRTRLSKIPDL